MVQNERWVELSGLASAQHGVFTGQQAANVGLSRGIVGRLVQRGVVERIHRGVFSFAGAPRTWRSRLIAATLAGGGSHASHRAAACLHQLDGFDEPQPIEVTVTRGRYPTSDNVIVHRWMGPDPHDYTEVDSVATSGVASTLARLGSVVPQPHVEQALDDALRRGYSLKWIEQTAERLHRPGPSGTGILLRLLRDPGRLGTAPDSIFERMTARMLNAADLPPPALQHPVRLPNGQAARIDIAWPSVKRGIECHSRKYHFGASNTAADHDRDHQLAMAGWQVTYLTWHQLQDSDYVLELARSMLDQRGRRSA